MSFQNKKGDSESAVDAVEEAYRDCLDMLFPVRKFSISSHWNIV